MVWQKGTASLWNYIIFFSVSQMAITDLVAEKDRGRYMGKIMIPMSVGMIVGPTLGGTLSKYFG